MYLAGDVREHILFQNLWLRLFRGGSTLLDYLWLCETLHIPKLISLGIEV